MLVDQINEVPVDQWDACSQRLRGLCSTLDLREQERYVEENEAFAFLTAANVVNKTWTETMGYPVTHRRRLPRNASQRLRPLGIPPSIASSRTTGRRQAVLRGA